MKKLLFVGDAGCPSGFAKATHAILETLRHIYDVTVLGINYRGDPHDYPYKIFAAAPGGDSFGIGRLVWMCDLVKPDVIILQNDGWNIPMYVSQLRTKKSNGEYAFPEHAGIPIVAIVAIDGKNFQGGWLDGVAHAIFWTKFALDEARLGGYEGPASVIPLGVDTTIFKPAPKREARYQVGIGTIGDAFVVGNVNRNQPRKRLDLTIKYFAAWVKQYTIDDAYLFLHVAPTGDTGTHVQQLAKYHGVIERLILVQPPTFYGITDEAMAATYNCFDVLISTTQGEGFGLTTLEAMACGVPCILPRWAALGDWAREAALMIPCPTTAVGPPYVNVIGGVPDQAAFVAALDAFYYSSETRAGYAKHGMALAREDRYGWAGIGQRYAEALQAGLTGADQPPQSNLGVPSFEALAAAGAVKMATGDQTSVSVSLTGDRL